MSKTTYNISLKGYVGGLDFDRSKVDKELAKNEGQEMNVLIDSLGGSLATGLSISAAFKNHGKVNVHSSDSTLPLQLSLRFTQLTSPLTHYICVLIVNMHWMQV